MVHSFYCPPPFIFSSGKTYFELASTLLSFIQLEKALAESTSKLQELIDPSLRGTFAYESMKTAVEISTKCLCEDPSARPTIEDVVWHLQYSMQVQQGWSTTSGNLSTKF